MKSPSWWRIFQRAFGITCAWILIVGLLRERHTGEVVMVSLMLGLVAGVVAVGLISLHLSVPESVQLALIPVVLGLMLSRAFLTLIGSALFAVLAPLGLLGSAVLDVLGPLYAAFAVSHLYLPKSPSWARAALGAVVLMVFGVGLELSFSHSPQRVLEDMMRPRILAVFAGAYLICLAVSPPRELYAPELPGEPR